MKEKSKNLTPEEKDAIEKLLRDLESLIGARDLLIQEQDKDNLLRMKFMERLADYTERLNDKPSKLDGDMNSLLDQFLDQSEDQKVLLDMMKVKLQQEDDLNRRLRERNLKRKSKANG